MINSQYKEHTRKVLKNIASFLLKNAEMEVSEIAYALPSLMQNDDFVEKIALGEVNDLVISKRTVYEIVRRI